MKRTITMTVVGVGLVALAAGGLVRFWPDVPPEARSTAPGAAPARLVCYGTIDSRQGPLLLLPARAGRVVEVLVKERQAVSKDAVLLQLDDFLARLHQQEASLAVEAAELQLARAGDGQKQHGAKKAQAEAALEAARAKLAAVEHELAIKEELFTNQAIKEHEVGAARALRDAARALVKAAQGAVAEVEAVDPRRELKLAQVQLARALAQRDLASREHDECLLKAPVDAVVLRVLAQPGDVVSPTSPRPAVWLVPRGGWVVRAEVSQEFAGRVKEGLAVHVEDEATGQLLGKGTIAEVLDWFLPRRQFGVLPTSINTGLTLECVIELREELAPLRFGQRVRVRVLEAAGGAGGK